MKSNFGRESAKIYQFPTKGVVRADPRRSKLTFATDLSTLPIVETTYGSGWYHDAAIREENRNHKL